MLLTKLSPAGPGSWTTAISPKGRSSVAHSDLKVFAGTDENRYTSVPGAWLPKSQLSPGISLAAFTLRLSGPGAAKAVSSSLPSLREGRFTNSPAVYTWQTWNDVKYRPYFKQSYFALQKVFGEIIGLSPKPSAERSALSLQER